MKKIILASGNTGKIKEFSEIFRHYQITLIPQSEYAVPEIEETGLSFVENAILKARNACRHTDLPALADDSGIEVDALHGAPGVYSARYAGLKAGQQQNNAKLLQELNGVPKEKRTARYRCILVFMRHALDPTPLICQGTLEGEVLEASRGEQGFGYDPIFWLPSYQCTVAEMAAEEKNRISHRAQAIAQLEHALREHQIL